MLGWMLSSAEPGMSKLTPLSLPRPLQIFPRASPLAASGNNGANGGSIEVYAQEMDSVTLTSRGGDGSRCQRELQPAGAGLGLGLKGASRACVFATWEWQQARCEGMAACASAHQPCALPSQALEMAATVASHQTPTTAVAVTGRARALPAPSNTPGTSASAPATRASGMVRGQALQAWQGRGWDGRASGRQGRLHLMGQHTQGGTVQHAPARGAADSAAACLVAATDADTGWPCERAGWAVDWLTDRLNARQTSVPTVPDPRHSTTFPSLLRDTANPQGNAGAKGGRGGNGGELLPQGGLHASARTAPHDALSRPICFPALALQRCWALRAAKRASRRGAACH